VALAGRLTSRAPAAPVVHLPHEFTAARTASFLMTDFLDPCHGRDLATRTVAIVCGAPAFHGNEVRAAARPQASPMNRYRRERLDFSAPHREARRG